MDIAIERVPLPNAEAHDLLGELDRELARFYAADQRHGLSIEHLFRTGNRFFIARIDGSAVGCGAVSLLGDHAEVRRMYVRPEARRQGVAQALLARIEREARGAGLALLRLETGLHQAPAIGLYERAGFARCPPFGAYAELASHAIETSLFFEKRL